MKVEFYKHSISDAEKNNVLDTLNSIFLTTGPKTKEFEEKFADYLGTKHAIGLSSCTSALFLALKSWGITHGDKVIVPAMTFIASSNAVIHAGATPVFVDVDPLTALIDLNQVEDVLKKEPDVKVILPVHLYGQMVDMQALRSIADNYDVRILEDCAHCVEGQRDGIKPGQLGDAAAFSFYATKNLTCGEGGALATNDEELSEDLRIIRLHGMSKSAADRHTKYQHWDMEKMGYKANMNDIQAAMLLPQIERIEQLWQRRNEIGEKYENEFEKHSIDFPRTLHGVKHARHLFTIWAADGRRDELISYLQQKNIGAVVNYRAVHLRDYYVKKYGFKSGDYPVAERIGERTISIPLYPKLTDAEQDYVVDAVVNF